MSSILPSSPEIPVESLRAAARRSEVIAAMRDFYEYVDRRIEELGPVCWNKGECCRFGQFGHRLYVTALEVAYYLARSGAAGDGEGDNPAVTGDFCPHAIAGRCDVRGHRPLGCRIFYCDPAARHWQGPLTEELLGQLRRLHEELKITYLYADWMTVLRALAREH